MSGEVMLLGGIGVSVSLTSWLATSWRGGDRAWLLKVARQGVEGVRLEASRVWLALAALFPSRRKKDECHVSLADVALMIDVVRLGLMAGLSFDAALELYCSHQTGALPKRMNQARLSWQMGIGSRGDELERAARDLHERALESFAVAVEQALSVGSPLSETLAAQSREIRAAHRASIEREIERTPVKLLIPTGTLILPALLLSIVGPLLAASGMI